MSVQLFIYSSNSIQYQHIPHMQNVWKLKFQYCCSYCLFMFAWFFDCVHKILQCLSGSHLSVTGVMYLCKGAGSSPLRLCSRRNFPVMLMSLLNLAFADWPSKALMLELWLMQLIHLRAAFSSVSFVLPASLFSPTRFPFHFQEQPIRDTVYLMGF